MSHLNAALHRRRAAAERHDDVRGDRSQCAKLQETLFVELVGEYGLRAYLGPGASRAQGLCRRTAGGWPSAHRVAVADDGRGRAARDWRSTGSGGNDGSAGGLVRGLLVPRETEFVRARSGARGDGAA